MGTYFAYWKRGWFVLLFVIAMNLSLGVVYAGLAFFLRRFLTNPLPTAVVVAWLLVGAPFAGWLFERFAGWSPRLSIASKSPS